MAKDVTKWQYKIQDPYHHLEVASAVQDFNTYDKFVDICFICDKGVKVYAHKLLLCPISTQIKKILLELPECVMHDTVTIHIPDIDSGTLHRVLDFLYEGSIKVTDMQYPLVQEAMKTLGIVLTNNTEEPQPGPSQAPPPQPTVQPTPQVVYLPTTPNNQGQMQYVMATQTGPMMTPVMQGSVASQHPAQAMFITQTGAQMMTPLVQGGTGQQHTPMIIDQASGQMIQSGGQMMSTQVQQSNLVPVMQQNNQMVTANQQQLVPNSRQVAAPSQGNIRSPQPVLMTRNQLQTSMQQNQVTPSNYVVNQSPQQQRRRAGQYNQTAQPQAPTLSHVNNTTPAQRRLTTEDILAVLTENGDDLRSLTAEIIQHSLESRLGVDLSGHKEEIKRVLKTVRDDSSTSKKIVPTDLHSIPSCGKKRGRKPKVQKKTFPFSQSDDEGDGDFNPKGGQKQPRKKGKRKSNYYN